MLSPNINNGLRRPAGIFRSILPKICMQFNNALHTANNLGVSVHLNRTTIYDPKILATQVVNRRLENDRRTLALFFKAIGVANSSAVDHMDKPLIRYDLELGIFLPDHLAKHELVKTAEDFLAIVTYEDAIEPLCNMGALRRFVDK